MRDDVSPRLIDLALEPAFALAGLEVRPASLEVLAGERREQLEPRIMQVLVALAGRRGEVVSRDELIQRCWGGRVVGDDSINRCIFQLRKLAESLGGFEIVTVPRVGFRLSGESPSVSPAHLHSTDVLLAVLAFDNLSSDEGLAYFSDGLSEEILHTVARQTDLKVIGRSSSFRFRGADKSARMVSENLGATHVLDGSVRRSGSRVRISVELVECAGQTSIWSDNFDRDLVDVLFLQDDVASAVAGVLKARFARPAVVHKVDPAAYDLFLKSRPAPGKGHIPPSQAIPLLENAVRLAPDFAGAWAALAHNRAAAHRGTHLDPVSVSVGRSDVVLAIKRALQLDPNSGSVHAALGNLLPWGDYAGRQAAFESALLSDPGSTDLRAELAWFLSYVGRNQDALDLTTEGLRLDPLDARIANHYSQMLCAVGRYRESQSAFADFRSRWPQLPVFISAPIMLAAAAGDWAQVEQLRPLAEGFKSPPLHLQNALRRAATLRDPTPRRRDRLLELLRDQAESTDAPDLGLLALAYKMGLTDEVFAIVEVASFDSILSEDGPSPAGSLSAGLIFDMTCARELIEDHRFPRLCAKLRLSEYWRATNRWPDCAAYVSYDFKTESRGLA